MHALVIVQQFLRTRCPHIHAVRLTVILAAVGAAVRGRRLTLTELGRSLPGTARVKHNIKRIDRLLGNRHLAAERIDLYRALAQRLLGTLREPVIIVDWSDLTTDRRWQLLRAALPVGGRALTLYEEIHPLRHFANPRVHRAFLTRLKTLLPEGVRPILVTDAGFRGPWFKTVNRLGWHWIGRIRNRDFVRPLRAEAWHGGKTLYAQASARPRGLGLFEVVRSKPFVCRLCLVKRPKRHRIKRSVFGVPVRSNQSLKQARAQREPWLLAASVSLAHLKPAEIVNLQIEEAFRDLKCLRYGLGFELHLSRSRERLAALLLIAALAFYALWLIGSRALTRGLLPHFQSNTRRSRPALSVFNLAVQVVRYATNQLLSHDLPHLHLPIHPPQPNHAL
jgi:Transposase DDE domain